MGGGAGGGRGQGAGGGQLRYDNLLRRFLMNCFLQRFGKNIFGGMGGVLIISLSLRQHLNPPQTSLKLPSKLSNPATPCPFLPFFFFFAGLEGRVQHSNHQLGKGPNPTHVLTPLGEQAWLIPTSSYIFHKLHEWNWGTPHPPPPSP